MTEGSAPGVTPVQDTVMSEESIPVRRKLAYLWQQRQKSFVDTEGPQITVLHNPTTDSNHPNNSQRAGTTINTQQTPSRTANLLESIMNRVQPSRYQTQTSTHVNGNPDVRVVHNTHRRRRPVDTE